MSDRKLHDALVEVLKRSLPLNAEFGERDSGHDWGAFERDWRAALSQYPEPPKCVHDTWEIREQTISGYRRLIEVSDKP